MIKDIEKVLNTYKGLPKCIYILFLGKIIACTGSCVFPLLTLILTRKANLLESQVGFIITITSVLQIPCILLGGKLADRIGRKTVLCFTQSIAAILYIFWGVVNDINLLVPILILASCFYVISMPAYDALVGDITDSNNRRETYSLLYIGLNIGITIGPILGGFLFEKYIQTIFIFDGITSLISVCLILFFVKSKKPKAVLSKSLKPEKSISVFSILKKTPIIVYFALIMILFQFSYSQFSFSIPIQLNELFNEKGASYFGILSSINAISVILLSPIISTYTKKYTIPKTIRKSSIFFIMSFFMFSFSENIYLFGIAIFIFTIGEIIISMNTTVFITNLAPESHRARIVSLVPLIMNLGIVLGPLVMGNIIEMIGIKLSWILLISVPLVGGVLINILDLFYIKNRELYE